MSKRRVHCRLLSLVCAFALAAPAYAALGVATIVDGHAFLLRGAERFSFSEGTRLEAEDIVESNNAELVLIEFTPGGSLRLGPQTRILLRNGGVFVLSGWVKVLSDDQSYLLQTPLAGVSVQGDTVAQMSEGALALFVEAGHAEPRPLAGTPVKLDAGRYSVLTASGSGEQIRPPQNFINAMPRPLRDRIPSRLARLQNADKPPVRAFDFRYEDVRAWMQTETLREEFAQRWRGRLNDEDFRRSVQNNLETHPEWRPLLRTPMAQAKRR